MFLPTIYKLLKVTTLFSLYIVLDIHFCAQHRGERRGLGGIFFDDLNDYDQEMLLSFATGNCLIILERFPMFFFNNNFTLLQSKSPCCTLFSKLAECANSVIPAYIPIIEKRKNAPFNDKHKAWQQLRRGRYVEFNLV